MASLSNFLSIPIPNPLFLFAPPDVGELVTGSGLACGAANGNIGCRAAAGISDFCVSYFIFS